MSSYVHFAESENIVPLLIASAPSLFTSAVGGASDMRNSGAHLGADATCCLGQGAVPAAFFSNIQDWSAGKPAPRFVRSEIDVDIHAEDTDIMGATGTTITSTIGTPLPSAEEIVQASVRPKRGSSKLHGSDEELSVSTRAVDSVSDVRFSVPCDEEERILRAVHAGLQAAGVSTGSDAYTVALKEAYSESNRLNAMSRSGSRTPSTESILSVRSRNSSGRSRHDADTDSLRRRGRRHESRHAYRETLETEVGEIVRTSPRRSASRSRRSGESLPPSRGNSRPPSWDSQPGASAASLTPSPLRSRKNGDSDLSVTWSENLERKRPSEQRRSASRSRRSGISSRSGSRSRPASGESHPVSQNSDSKDTSDGTLSRRFLSVNDSVRESTRSLSGRSPSTRARSSHRRRAEALRREHNADSDEGEVFNSRSSSRSRRSTSVSPLPPPVVPVREVLSREMPQREKQREMRSATTTTTTATTTTKDKAKEKHKQRKESAMRTAVEPKIPENRVLTAILKCVSFFD